MRQNYTIKGYLVESGLWRSSWKRVLQKSREFKSHSARSPCLPPVHPSCPFYHASPHHPQWARHRSHCGWKGPLWTRTLTPAMDRTHCTAPPYPYGRIGVGYDPYGSPTRTEGGRQAGREGGLLLLPKITAPLFSSILRRNETFLAWDN